MTGWQPHDAGSCTIVGVHAAVGSLLFYVYCTVSSIAIIQSIYSSLRAGTFSPFHPQLCTQRSDEVSSFLEIVSFSTAWRGWYSPSAVGPVGASLPQRLRQPRKGFWPADAAIRAYPQRRPILPPNARYTPYDGAQYLPGVLPVLRPSYKPLRH